MHKWNINQNALAITLSGNVYGKKTERNIFFPLQLTDKVGCHLCLVGAESANVINLQNESNVSDLNAYNLFLFGFSFLS